MLAAMVNASRRLPLMNLLFALLARWLGLRRTGPAPTRLVITRADAMLAHPIRATLTQDEAAFPDLNDAALLVYFKTRYPALARACRVFGSTAPRAAPL